MHYKIGDYVERDGAEAVVIWEQGGYVPTYRLRYLKGRGPGWARAEELTPLGPLPALKVGDDVPIAGLRGVVLEVLGEDRYRIGAAFTRAGVLHKSEWIVDGWQIAGS